MPFTAFSLMPRRYKADCHSPSKTNLHWNHTVPADLNEPNSFRLSLPVTFSKTLHW